MDSGYRVEYFIFEFLIFPEFFKGSGLFFRNTVRFLTFFTPFYIKYLKN